MNLRLNWRPSSDQRVIVGIGLMLVLIGCVIAASSRGEFELGKQLRQHGIHTPGKISSIQAEKTLVVAYSYSVGTKRYTNHATLQGEISNTMGPGGPVDVIDLPNEPSRSLCSLESLNSPGYASRNLGIAILLGVSGLLFMVMGFKSDLGQKPA